MTATASGNRRRYIEELQRKVDPRASGFITFDLPTVIQELDPTLGSFPDDETAGDQFNLSFDPYIPNSSHLNVKSDTKRTIKCYLTKKTIRSKVLQRKQTEWESENAEGGQRQSFSTMIDHFLSDMRTEADANDVEMCLVLDRVKRNKDGSLNMPQPPMVNSEIHFTLDRAPLLPWVGTIKTVIEYSGKEGGKRMVDLVLGNVERVPLK